MKAWRYAALPFVRPFFALNQGQSHFDLLGNNGSGQRAVSFSEKADQMTIFPIMLIMALVSLLLAAFVVGISFGLIQGVLTLTAQETTAHR